MCTNSDTTRASTGHHSASVLSEVLSLVSVPYIYLLHKLFHVIFVFLLFLLYIDVVSQHLYSCLHSYFIMRALHTTLLVCQCVVAIQARTLFKFPQEWQMWKAEHGKLYLSELEELEKHLVWLSNKKYIEAHNAASDVFGYTLELNKFADLVRQMDINTACA